jgi:hypothetical protein
LAATTTALAGRGDGTRKLATGVASVALMAWYFVFGLPQSAPDASSFP